MKDSISEFEFGVLRARLLPLGVSLQGRGRASARLFARGARRRRDDERACSKGVGFGSLFGSATSWRAASDLSGASGARRRFAREHGAGRSAAAVQAVVRPGVRSAKNISAFAASTIAAKKRALERQLAELLAAPTGCERARQLQVKIAGARDQFLTFCDYPGEVDATNNGSERKLRPCVIQRKVTNGYRAMWAAQAEADVRTTVDTARLKGAAPFLDGPAISDKHPYSWLDTNLAPALCNGTIIVQRIKQIRNSIQSPRLTRKKRKN